MENEVKKEINTLIRLKSEIKAVIDAVPSQIERELLEYRYINCWRWNKIARAMNYNVDSLWRIHKNALKNIEPHE